MNNIGPLTACDAFTQSLCSEADMNGVGVTWLNHYTIQHTDFAALKRLDFIGVDGTLLQLILRLHGVRIGRTSADLVLPEFLAAQKDAGRRIAFIGGEPGVASAAANRVGGIYIALDGFDDLKRIMNSPQWIASLDLEVLVLGLGAGLQDPVAAQLRSMAPRATVITAGGWLDQAMRSQQYFPEWIHSMRLGWAWRILHEPARLMRRYTIDAVVALRKSYGLVAALEKVGHYQRMEAFKSPQVAAREVKV